MRRTRPTEAPGERHRRAVAQTINWAREAAEAGHDQEALEWLRMLEAVEGQLPPELEPLCEQCLANLAATAERERQRRRRLAA